MKRSVRCSSLSLLAATAAFLSVDALSVGHQHLLHRHHYQNQPSSPRHFSSRRTPFRLPETRIRNQNGTTTSSKEVTTMDDASKETNHQVIKDDGDRTPEIGEPATPTNEMAKLSPFAESSEMAVSKSSSSENDGELSLWAARGLLLLVAAIWGTNFASVKYLESLCFHPPCSHPPSEFAFARFAVAALVSLPLLFRQRLDVILAGFECGLWISLGYATQALALSTISAGKCAFICSLTVIVVPIIALVLYGRPIKLGNVVAAFLALSGVAVLEGMVDFNALLGISPAVAHTGTNILTSASSSSTTEVVAAAASAATGPLASLASSLGVGKGDLIALGQPIGFGYCFLRIEYYQEKFKEVPNRVLTIAAAQCVSVGIMSVLWVLNDYDWTIPDFGYMVEPHRIAAIAWTGIVTTVFAIFLEGIALQKATATDAAIIFSSEPVWASAFGFILLNEKLGQNSYIGGAVIMVACLLGALSDMDADHSFGHALEDTEHDS